MFGIAGCQTMDKNHVNYIQFTISLQKEGRCCWLCKDIRCHWLSQDNYNGEYKGLLSLRRVCRRDSKVYYRVCIIWSTCVKDQRSFSCRWRQRGSLANGKVSTRERYNISSQHKMRNLVTAQSEIYGPKVYINFFCLAIRLLETNEYNNLRCSRC